MHAMLFKHSMVTTGKGAHSRFARIDMLMPVEAEALEVAVVALVVGSAEECVEVLGAVAVSEVEEVSAEGMAEGEVAIKVVEAATEAVVHRLLVATALGLLQSLRLLTHSLTSRRPVVREVQQSSSETCHGLPAMKILLSSSQQSARLSELRSSMNPTDDRVDLVWSNSIPPTMLRLQSPSLRAISMVVGLLVWRL